MGAADGLRRPPIRTNESLIYRLRMTLRGSPDARELEFLADVEEPEASSELRNPPASPVFGRRTGKRRRSRRRCRPKSRIQSDTVILDLERLQVADPTGDYLNICCFGEDRRCFVVSPSSLLLGVLDSHRVGGLSQWLGVAATGQSGLDWGCIALEWRKAVRFGANPLC